MSEESFISIDDWNACAVKEKTDLVGRKVYIGLDMPGPMTNGYGLDLSVKRRCTKIFVNSHSFVATEGCLDQKISGDKIE